MERRIDIYEIERERKWRERAELVPALSFRECWQVKIVPPFAGADARFFVASGSGHVSVYLDFDSRLGYMPEGAYWEIYPAADGDTERFMLDEADALIEGIAASLAAQNSAPPPAPEGEE